MVIRFILAIVAAISLTGCAAVERLVAKTHSHDHQTARAEVHSVSSAGTPSWVHTQRTVDSFVDRTTGTEYVLWPAGATWSTLTPPVGGEAWVGSQRFVAVDAAHLVQFPASLRAPARSAAPKPVAQGYTVQKGDTLSKLSKAMGCRSAKELALLNGIPNPDLILIGQKLMPCNTVSHAQPSNSTLVRTNYGHVVVDTAEPTSTRRSTISSGQPLHRTMHDVYQDELAWGQYVRSLTFEEAFREGGETLMWWNFYFQQQRRPLQHTRNSDHEDSYYLYHESQSDYYGAQDPFPQNGSFTTPEGVHVERSCTGDCDFSDPGVHGNVVCINGNCY